MNKTESELIQAYIASMPIEFRVIYYYTGKS